MNAKPGFMAPYIVIYTKNIKITNTNPYHKNFHGSKQEKAFRKMNRQPELSTTTSSLNITPASKINTILFLSPTSKPISINSGKKVGGASFANLRFLSNAKLGSEAYTSLGSNKKGAGFEVYPKSWRQFLEVHFFYV